MKARLIRFAFALHRWMGVTLGVLMLMWCLSGFVMIFAPYPATSRGGHDLRVEGLAPIILPETVRLPAAAAFPPDARLASARIEMMGKEAVLRMGGAGVAGVFSLSTGEAIKTISADDALAVATTYAERHGIAARPEISKLSKRDEFTVAGYFNSARPFWQVRLNDPARTMLYVSSRSGEIRQLTTRQDRVLSWLGAIPHWLYFTTLRQDAKLWNQVVIWASLAGCFLTLLGLFVGVRQLRRRHSTGKLASPYRGVKTWHHLLGLVFGVLVLSWTFSGFTSMQPWGWFETGQAASEAAARYSGEGKRWSEARNDLFAQIDAVRRLPSGAVLQVSSAAAGGALYFVQTATDGSRLRLDADGAPAPFDAAQWAHAGDVLGGNTGPAKAERLTKEDDYYYKGAAASAFPVVRIVVPAMQDTRFYLDSVSGQILSIADPGNRGFRWWHMAPHRLDFAWLRVGWLRQSLEIVLLVGVTAVCGAGAWMGLIKLRRGGRLDGRP
ncbi:MAG: peptidase [Alphaproteobacteria bacterium]|nr:peptidase [Alphaproteobacteria bacterium]